MASPRSKEKRITLGADRGYDVRGFVSDLRQRNISPYVAQLQHRRSSIDKRTTRHAGYSVSQRVRKRVEEIFVWMKSAGGLHQVKVRGSRRVGWTFTFAAAGYNIVRIRI